MYPAKRRKMKNEEDEEPASRSAFTETLNDDCVFEIMKWLPLDELCSLSSTCRSLQQLAQHFFTRRFPEQAGEIKEFENKNRFVKYNGNVKNYVKCFCKMPNISLDNSYSSPAKLAELKLVFQCRADATINKIRFEKWRKLRPIDGTNLAELLNQVTSVTLSDTVVDGDLYKFFQHLPNMEELILWKNFDQVGQHQVKENWLSKTYPKLKHFAWHLNQELNVTTEMIIFFERNKQINKFSLYTANIETIKDCVNNRIKITELYIHINENVVADLQYIREFCDGDTSKRLHVSFDDSCRAVLSKNLKSLLALRTNVDGLYFDGRILHKPLAETISKFEHLKILQAKSCQSLELLADLPNLEELYISHGIKLKSFPQIHGIMSTFISQSANLKLLYVRNNAQPYRNFGFDSFDESRKNVANRADDLTIFFKSEAEYRVDELARMKLAYDTFKIAAVGVEDVNNPLVTEYLYSRNVHYRRESLRYIKVIQ